MAWQPDATSLQQLVQLLANSMVPDQEVQKRTYDQLQQFNSVADYNHYLVYIFTKLTDPAQEMIRIAAGLQIKNNLSRHFDDISPEARQYIKSEVLVSLADSSPVVRNTSGSIVTGIISSGGGLASWPELLGVLVSFLDNPNMNVVDGALSTLHKICEDHNEELESSTYHEALQALIPRFLSFFRSPHEQFRRVALSCINQFIVHMPEALLSNLETFLQGIFFLATEDRSPLVRKCVCEAFVMLITVREVSLMPHIGGVVQFMLQATQDEDEHVSLEACEFWPALADTEICTDALSMSDFLPRLLQVLLSCMVYTEEELSVLCPTEDNESVPDRPEDIKPRFARSSKSGGQSSSGGGGGDDDDDDDDDDDGGGFSDNTEWNLRKCAAFSLDMLAGVFRDRLLPPLLPLLTQKLGPEVPWPVRESAILAFGAIASGCYNGLLPDLGGLIQFLVQQLEAPQALIRSIACWSISQYSRWIVEKENEDTYFKPILLQLLGRMLDHNKRVQEAACSAFATLEEEAHRLLIPLLDPIVATICQAFRKYQAKNLLILYDAIGTLADCVQGELAKPNYTSTLLPLLLEKWEETPDSDRSLLPLIECLGSVASALRIEFQHFTRPIFERCLKIIESSLLVISTNGGVGDRDFIICSLDLISAFVDALEGGIESLVGGSNLLNLLHYCMQDFNGDVRQSAFALVGDIAKFCPVHLRPAIPHYVPLLLRSVLPENTASSNNACWALGEITFSSGTLVAPFVPDLVTALIPIITGRRMAASLLENSAITLGRLALVSPDAVAVHLPTLAQCWCSALASVRAHQEKEAAFHGLCAVVRLNPNGMVSALEWFIKAIASWNRNAPTELHANFCHIVHGYKNFVPEVWAHLVQSLDSETQSILQQYNA